MRISDWSSDVCSSDLDVFEAFDLDPAPQRIDRPPPRACELEHADRQRAEVFAQQRFARGGVESGEAQLQVAQGDAPPLAQQRTQRSEEHTSELQSLMRISSAVFCLKKKNNKKQHK